MSLKNIMNVFERSRCDTQEGKSAVDATLTLPKILRKENLAHIQFVVRLWKSDDNFNRESYGSGTNYRPHLDFRTGFSRCDNKQ